MVDLNEVCGDVPMKASLLKKKAKAQERLNAVMSKAQVITAEIQMYDEMIAAIDKRMTHGGIAEEKQASEELPAFLRNNKEESPPMQIDI